MSKLFNIALKDIRLEFSSLMALLTFILLPAVFTVIFAGRFAGDDGGGVVGIPLVVVDLDRSDFSADLIQRLEQSDAIAPSASSLEDAEGTYENDSATLLIVPSGFGELAGVGKSAELELRLQPNDTNGIVIGQAVQAAVGELSRALAIAAQSTDALAADGAFADDGERQVYFDGALESAEIHLASLPARIETTQPEAAADNSFDVLSQQAIGQLITWVFIPLLGTSVLFSSERIRGTLRRIVTTPTSKATYMAGTVLGQVSKALVQMMLIILVGYLAYGISYANNPLALLIVLLSFALAGTAFGTMLGTFVKSDSQANGLSVMLGMVMSLLGGCWFPLEFFPPAAQTVAKFLPTRWALVGVQDLVVRGQGVSGILLESGVLLLFAAVFFAIGVWRFRFE